MLESVMSWLLTTMVGAFDGLIFEFFSMINMDPGVFIARFPIVTTLYEVLRGTAAGLVLGIVVFQLLKYFAGGLSSQTETPLRLVGRGCLALILVFAGNYLLMYAIDLFKLPYDAMIGQLGLATNQPDAGKIFEGLTLSTAWDKVQNVLTGGVAVQLLLEVFFVLAIGINLVKLMLEVVERWLMLYVMVFTAPLGWATYCSATTLPVFKKWVTMFLSQCLMMVLSVWSVCMVLSVLTTQQGYDDNFLLQLVIGLSFCRVAQHLDQYMQNIGVNVGQAGGSLIDELMFAGNAMKKMGVGEGGGGAGIGGKKAGKGILGKAFGATNIGAPGSVLSYLGRGGAAKYGLDAGLTAVNAFKNANGNVIEKTGAAVKDTGKFIGNTRLVGNGISQHANGVAKRAAQLNNNFEKAKHDGFGTITNGSLSALASGYGMKLTSDAAGKSYIQSGGAAIREGFCGQNMAAFKQGSEEHGIIKNTVDKMGSEGAFRAVDAGAALGSLNTDIAHQAFQKTGIESSVELPSEFTDAVSAGKYSVDKTKSYVDDNGDDVVGAYGYIGTTTPYVDADSGEKRSYTYETVSKAAYASMPRQLQSEFTKHVSADQQAWFTKVTRNVEPPKSKSTSAPTPGVSKK